MTSKLTTAERATIMDACASISHSADELKNCHTVDGDWGDDVDAKAFYDAELRLLARLTALLAPTQQPSSEPASAGVIAAALALIEADRAQTLTTEHVNALDNAIKIQRGTLKLPQQSGEVTPLKVERHSDMSVLVVFGSCRQASVFEKEIGARAQGGES
ncbi:hypothetical protein BTHA_2741 [Burkholderia thailandensis MSMB59]|nr:hypothetical protein BTHA_2741 [Burkholderia thailandensis MSMB59]AOJ44833.1 hypothetical protein WJ27_06745 [Burkholderia thailandensis]